jgi:hypothetical protein
MTIRTKKKIYFNDPQQKVMFTGAKTVVVVGGRRLGKSHGIVAPFLLRNFQRMPRSSGAFVCSTFQQGLTRTIPGTLSALESFGFKRNVHFFIGRRPPLSARFAEPIIKPESYDHVISWYNGSIQHIITQDGVGTSNSLTLDYLIMDEAKLLDFDKLKNETFPANGGFRGHFGHLPWHHGSLIVSDMPTTKRGSWFLSYDEKCDRELIDTIHGIIYEKWRLYDKIQKFKSQGVEPPKYIYSIYKGLCKSLAELQSVAVDYNVFSSIDNLQVLGENYIKQMKRDLPPLVFQTSILCKKVGLLKDGFYNNLKESVHYYSAFDNSYLQSLDYNFDKSKELSCLQDGDLDQNSPICIAMDYNANINWIVAAQQSGIKMKVLKSFYVKYDRKLVELVNDFCVYYRHFKRKDVVYYYDNTALGSNYAVNSDDFASVVINTFKSNGWTVNAVHIGNPIKHIEKHNLINMAFKGQKGLFPMFNRNNNESLLLAMEQCGIYQGPNGFKKDKRGEKLVESEEDKLETRTDGTDAFDTLFVGMNNFPASSSFSGSIFNSFI